MIIGLVGKKQSGKTTIANMLEQQWPDFEILSFATPLKNMLLQAGFCTYEEMYIEKTPESRTFMQKIGTDLIRRQIDPDFWVKKMKDQIGDSEYPHHIIDDVRFQNEAQFIRSSRLGILVRIERFGLTFDDHPSETEVDKIKTDCAFINEGKSIIELNKHLEILNKMIAECVEEKKHHGAIYIKNPYTPFLGGIL